MYIVTMNFIRSTILEIDGIHIDNAQWGDSKSFGRSRIVENVNNWRDTQVVLLDRLLPNLRAVLVTPGVPVTALLATQHVFLTPEESKTLVLCSPHEYLA